MGSSPFAKRYLVALLQEIALTVVGISKEEPYPVVPDKFIELLELVENLGVVLEFEI